jgi:cytochrome oxidase Cu insertion factor (SCO1/SenC/PrrC family)
MSADRTPVALLASWLAITFAWWALALAPVADPPAWLVAARAVCFGATESGLPDTWGWLLLTAAPGTMLVAIFFTWHDDLATFARVLARSGAGRAAMAATLAVVVAGTSWAGLRIASGLAIERTDYSPFDLGALPPTYPRLDRAVPDFALVDQQGRAFTPETLRGRVTLLTFAFAHCHTVCPVIVHTVRSAAEKMPELAPRVAVITLDPWRDTPSRLPQMHKDWKLADDALVLSGDVEAVVAALDGFNVSWERNEETGDVVHPPLVYALDREGRLAYAFNNPTIDWMIEAARRAAH